jgi:ABC-type transport system involved in multi-copper enzyme maturation permease subunit
MPIHDQGYRRYLGNRAAIGRSWKVMATAGIMTMVRKRMFILLMLFSWLGYVLRAIQFYLSEVITQAASILAPKGDTFREFLDNQNIFVFFVAIWVGAGLIANDRRANALQLYLSKPMTSAEYIAGKFAILFVFLTSVTFLPAMMLLLTQAILSGSLTFIRSNIYLLPAITLYSLLLVIVASISMLALSSLSKSSRFVGVMFAGLVFFTLAFFNALRGITGTSSFAWLAPSAALAQIGDVIFRVTPRYSVSPVAAAVAIIVLVAVSLWILKRRIRGVEIVT